jgi:hypothetical protein
MFIPFLFYIVSSDFSTPPLSEQPMMLKIKDVYNQVIRLRLDPTKRDVELFRIDYCGCTIGHVGEAFKRTGYLCSFTATMGTYMLRQKYKNSDKFVVPYSACVSVSFYMMATVLFLSRFY